MNSSEYDPFGPSERENSTSLVLRTCGYIMTRAGSDIRGILNEVEGREAKEFYYKTPQELLDRLHAIKDIDCRFKHEDGSFRPEGCKLREFNGGCGHQGCGIFVRGKPISSDANNPISILNGAILFLETMGVDCSAERGQIEPLASELFYIDRIAASSRGLNHDVYRSSQSARAQEVLKVRDQLSPKLEKWIEENSGVVDTIITRHITGNIF